MYIKVVIGVVISNYLVMSVTPWLFAVFMLFIFYYILRRL